MGEHTKPSCPNFLYGSQALDLSSSSDTELCVMVGELLHFLVLQTHHNQLGVRHTDNFWIRHWQIKPSDSPIAKDLTVLE